LCIDDDGKRWTLRGDPELVKMATDARPETLAGLTVGGASV
jgi:hypothetical protein